MAVIPIMLAGRSYDVIAGSGLIHRLSDHAGAMLRKKRVPIVADQNALHHWQAALSDGLVSAGYEPVWFVVPPGEASKSWDSLIKLIDWLLAENVERGDYVIALGGGVVGDLTGFACSILKRGCGFIQLPTTLLSQVDSSVGGKTAINVPAGKNLIGAFHQPSLVLADIDVLSTLPPRELRAGYAEIIKYGILGDSDFFEWCESNGAQVVYGNRDALEYAVSRSVEAKAKIVAEDERETSGARALLNLGHTFGHALEAETGYSDRLLHGEAVALGMVLAAFYSARRGTLSLPDAQRITRAIAAADLPTDIKSLGLEREGKCDGAKLVSHMLHDKKMDAGTLPFILLRGIGAAYLDREVDLDDVAQFLDEQLQIK